jgi:ataxin-3
MNLSQHWLPLRRFAGRSDRWYNLNSLLVGPEWLSSTYLSLAINTAEDEGHSVFVIRKAGSEEAQEQGFSALPECQADLMGLQLGSPSAGGGSGFSDGQCRVSGQLVMYRLLILPTISHRQCLYIHSAISGRV